eukprot:933498-Amorphochlora_amoeboformis.AAC.1
MLIFRNNRLVPRLTNPRADLVHRRAHAKKKAVGIQRTSRISVNEGSNEGVGSAMVKSRASSLSRFTGARTCELTV